MAFTITATVAGQLTVVVTRDDIESAGAESVSYHSAFNIADTLTASTTPPVTKKFSDELTATLNLDLAAYTDPELGADDATGLKVQAIRVNNLSTTNILTISDGAANPYQLNGGADIVVPIGGWVEMYFNDQLADVAAGAKTIDFTPTAGQGYQVMIIMG